MIGPLLDFIDDRGLLRRFHVLAVASALARALVVLLLVPVLSRLLSSAPSQAWPWIGLLTLAVVAGWFVDQRYADAGFDVGFTLLRRVELRVLDHVEQVPLPLLGSSVQTSTQRAVATAGQELCSAFAYVVAPLYATLMSTVLVAGGLLFVDVALGVAALASAALLGCAMAASNRLLRSSEARFDAASAAVGEQVVELAQAQRILRAAGRPEGAAASETRVGRALGAQRRAALRLIGASTPGQVMFAVVSQVALLSLAVVAVHQVRAGALDAAEVVALVVVAVRFLDPFFNAADLSPALELVRGALHRIDAVLQVPTLGVDATSSASDPAGPALELRGVSYAYPSGPEVLHDVDLVVEHGRTVAVVGPSGSGKSTLLALAARFDDPTRGQVLREGRDVRSVPVGDLVHDVGVVLQDVRLADTSIRENVRLARPSATDEQVQMAAEAARLDEVVARLPDAWDTRVGEGGRLLSGGERQRVAVARALLREAPLLLLDEATSAIDARTEAAVVAALESGSSRRATLVVAHRLTTIARADEVVFLEAGRIVERGAPRDLLAAGGRFAAYWHQREAAGSWVLR